jgi:hypothetical protein
MTGIVNHGAFDDMFILCCFSLCFVVSKRLNVAIDTYGSVLMKSGVSANDSYIQALLQQKQLLVNVLNTNDLSHLQQFSSVMQIQAMSQNSWKPDLIKAAVFPVLPKEVNWFECEGLKVI